MDFSGVVFHASSTWDNQFIFSFQTGRNQLNFGIEVINAVDDVVGPSIGLVGWHNIFLLFPVQQIEYLLIASHQQWSYILNGGVKIETLYCDMGEYFVDVFLDALNFWCSNIFSYGEAVPVKTTQADGIEVDNPDSLNSWSSKHVHHVGPNPTNSEYDHERILNTFVLLIPEKFYYSSQLLTFYLSILLFVFMVLTHFPNFL